MDDCHGWLCLCGICRFGLGGQGVEFGYVEGDRWGWVA